MTFIRNRAGDAVRSALLIAAIGSALALSGCGEEATPDQVAGGDGSVVPDPDDVPAITDNPCELLSQEEAAAIAGNPVNEGKHQSFLCIWEPEDVTDSSQVQVSVSYVPIPPGSDPDAICESSLPGLPDAEPFTGIALGNAAYWDYRPAPLGNAGNMHVCADNALIQAQVVGGRAEDELQQMAISIATTVLGRI
jgi:hypothetical protein